MSDYTCVAGDTLPLVVTVVDQAGAAVNLAGAVLVYAIYSEAGVEVVRKTSAAGQITISGNVATITIAAGETTSLANQVAYHELQVTDSTGRVETLQLRGLDDLGSVVPVSDGRVTILPSRIAP